MSKLEKVSLFCCGPTLVFRHHAEVGVTWRLPIRDAPTPLDRARLTASNLSAAADGR